MPSNRLPRLLYTRSGINNSQRVSSTVGPVVIQPKPTQRETKISILGRAETARRRVWEALAPGRALGLVGCGRR